MNGTNNRTIWDKGITITMNGTNNTSTLDKRITITTAIIISQKSSLFSSTITIKHTK